VSETMAYKDPGRSVEERVEDVLSRMTLEEKVGQMCQLNGREEPERWLHEKHAGSFLHVMGEVNNKLQRLAEESRLGIPIIFGIDAIHGHAFWPTATVFPTQLGLSCSWNPELVEEIGRITAKEASATGVHWTFSPVLGTARDLRWGRIDETFGEDPHLIGVLGSALVRGYQGDDLADPHTILACAKHYAGYSGTQGGAGRVGGRSHGADHAIPVSAAFPGCGTGGVRDSDGRLPIHRWPPLYGQPVAAAGCAEGGMGVRGVRGDRLEQRRADAHGTKGVRDDGRSGAARGRGRQ